MGVVYVSGFLVSSHGGVGRVSVVTRDCSFSKGVCSVSNMVWGCEVILPVSGLVIVVRFGWSLAHGCRRQLFLSYGGIVWGSFCIVHLPFSL